MASELENLQAARLALSARIAELYTAPKPNYSIDGISVSWNEYRKQLMDEYERLGELINQANPFESRSRGRPV